MNTQQFDLLKHLLYFSYRRTTCFDPEVIAEELHTDVATLNMWKRRYGPVIRYLSDAVFLFVSETVVDAGVQNLLTHEKGRKYLDKMGLMQMDANGKPRLHPEWWAAVPEPRAKRPKRKDGEEAKGVAH